MSSVAPTPSVDDCAVDDCGDQTTFGFRGPRTSFQEAISRRRELLQGVRDGANDLMMLRPSLAAFVNIHATDGNTRGKQDNADANAGADATSKDLSQRERRQSRWDQRRNCSARQLIANAPLELSTQHAEAAAATGRDMLAEEEPGQDSKAADGRARRASKAVSSSRRPSAATFSVVSTDQSIQLTHGRGVDNEAGESDLDDDSEDEDGYFLATRRKWYEYIALGLVDLEWNLYINPESKAKRMWDLFVILLVLYVATVVPFSLCLIDKLESEETGSADTMIDPQLSRTISICDKVSDVFFVLDLIVNFRTGELSPDGKLVRNARAIATEYASGWLAIDFISSVPPLFLDEESSGSAASVTSIFKCLRLLRMGKLARKLEQLGSAIVLRIVKKLGGFLLAVHWAACIWFYIGSVVNQMPVFVNSRLVHRSGSGITQNQECQTITLLTPIELERILFHHAVFYHAVGTTTRLTRRRRQLG